MQLSWAARRWHPVRALGSWNVILAELISEVKACVGAGIYSPPGWTKQDESGKGVSVSEIPTAIESRAP